MPWVLSQYNSSTIDLRDISVYRDLSKPMGALNANRLGDFLDRYESFSESETMDIPAFMYGSHYSTMVSTQCLSSVYFTSQLFLSTVTDPQYGP